MNQVIHFSTSLNGGAGISSQRLHEALCHNGIASSLIFRQGFSDLNNIKCDRRYTSILWRNLESITINHQWKQGNCDRSLFTSPKWIYKTHLQDIIVQSSVVINLHWISRWIDQPSFFNSIPENIPVVWSLHDMNPITGGCHHALGCDLFTHHCSNCPNLKKPGNLDQSWKNFELKAKLYQKLNLHFVGNSTWTTAQAKKSALGQYARSLQTIPLGIDTQLFRPLPKSLAKDALQIQPSHFAIGFACADLSDQNKNLSGLLRAIQGLSSDCAITLIVFGAGDLPTLPNAIQAVKLGNLSSPLLQCIAYSAADVFVMPSRIESFGLTALEAMACATPVIAYRTGGLSDLIVSGETGFLVDEIGSVEGLQKALQWMQGQVEARNRMGLACRQRVEQYFTTQQMAESYISLYEGLVMP